MDFFAHQDAARAATRRLVLMMAVAIAVMVLLVNLLVAWGLSLTHHNSHGYQVEQVAYHAPQHLHLLVTVGTLLVIGIGSWLKIMELRGGGPALAVQLGGREVMSGGGDPGERRFRNVVEEMAIAAGVPVPAVFVLPETGINAFAAGHNLNDSAIAVTRGCLETLTRDELQGVVAHEMSHLLNGDARLNLRLIGAVYGLLALSEIGWMLVRTGSYGSGGYDSRGRERNNGLPLIAIGFGLVVIGGLGWLLAELVRAAVSRQREFLADSSAVQFTRNGQAVADALKKALRPDVGTRMTHAGAAMASHMFFASGGFSFSDMFATHPPLAERIKRIDPGWDGTTFPMTRPLDVEPRVAAGQNQNQNQQQGRGAFGPLGAALPVAVLGGMGGVAVGAGVAMGAGAAMGGGLADGGRTAAMVAPGQVDFAAQLLAQLPSLLSTAANEPYGSRAAVLVTMLAADPEAQLARIRAGDEALAGLVTRLLPRWRELDAARARLPLLHLALPSLGKLTAEQRARFLLILDEVAASATGAGADKAAGETASQAVAPLVAKLVHVHLAERRPPPDFQALKPLLPDVATALAGLAAASAAPGQAFAAGWARLMMPGMAPALPADPGAAALLASLDRLARANGAIRRRVVEAAAYAVAADGTVAPREAELLRLTCECLGLPLPLFRDQSAA